MEHILKQIRTIRTILGLKKNQSVQSVHFCHPAYYSINRILQKYYLTRFVDRAKGNAEVVLVVSWVRTETLFVQLLKIPSLTMFLKVI